MIRGLSRLLDEALPFLDGVMGIIDLVIPANLMVLVVTVCVMGFAEYRGDVRKRIERDERREDAVDRQEARPRRSFERRKWGWRSPRGIKLSPVGLVLEGRKETRTMTWDEVVRWNVETGRWKVRGPRSTLKFRLAGYEEQDRQEIEGRLFLNLPDEAEDTFSNLMRRTRDRIGLSRLRRSGRPVAHGEEHPSA